MADNPEVEERKGRMLQTVLDKLLAPPMPRDIFLSMMTSDPRSAMLETGLATTIEGSENLQLTIPGKVFIAFWAKLVPDIPLPPYFE